LPPELIQQSAWLCVYQSWTRHWAGQREHGEICLSNAENLLNNATSLDEAEKNKLGGSIATVRAHYALVNEQLSLAIEQAQKAMQLLPKTDYYTPVTAGIALGGAYWGQGKVGEAEQAFLSCAATALKGGFVPRAASALVYAGMQQVKQAELSVAEKTFQKALSLAQGPEGRSYPVAGYPLVKLGELACEWNQLAQAQKLVNEGVILCEQLGHVDLIAEAYAGEARVQLACADFDGVQATLHKAEQLAVETKLDPWAIAWLDDCQVRLWLATGNLKAASHWAETSGVDVEAEFSYHYDLNHLTLARVLVAQIVQKSKAAHPEQCSNLLDRLLTATEQMGWRQHEIQVFVQQALVLQAFRDEGRALQALSRAVALAAPEKYVRVFVGEGQPIEELLRHLREEQTSSYIDQLLIAFQQEFSTQSSDLVEALSPRETEVLQLLTTSFSVPEIAKELVLSPHTVRSHIKNIYGKLGVNRRMDAVKVAIELKLV
jgi:LuxR family maltose regulon positive regulatory protein